MKNKKQTKEKYNKLRGRKTALDRRFQFTPENIKKIEAFNAALLRKSHELFALSDIALLSENDISLSVSLNS